MNLQIQQEAADWFVEFRTGEPDGATRKAFAAWIRQSPEHLRAYLEMAEIWQDTPQLRADALQSVSALIEDAQREGNVIPLRDGSSLGPPAAEFTSTTVRRRAWFAAAAASVLLLMGSVAIWWVRQQNVYATGVGEERTVVLADGSTVQLNSQTQFRVAFRPRQRDIELIQGQAMFHVAKDPSRPFVVHSEGAVVRAVGTEFDVYRKSRATVVTVVEGRVAVMADSALAALTTYDGSGAAPLSSSIPTVMLAAGEQLTVSKQQAQKPVAVDAAVATSWTQHRIVFKHTPLAEVFAELNRYSRRTLRVQGPGLEEFLISGTYLTNDPTVLVEFLKGQPGVTVQETEQAIVVSKAP